MKVMAYNILDGGVSPVGDRTAMLLRILRDAAPDVLGVTECGDFDPRAALGLERVGYAPECRARLFVKPSITVREWDASLPFAISATVDCDGVDLTLVVAHLHAHSGDERLREAEALARAAAPRRYLALMGDMNSIAPGESPDFETEAWPSARARLYDAAGVPDTRAIESLAAAGLIDLGRDAAAATYPTQLHRCRDVAAFRLDYLFASAPLAAVARPLITVTGGDAEIASDHRPVTTTFSLRDLA